MHVAYPAKVEGQPPHHDDPASQPANAEGGPMALIRSARAAWNLSCRPRADV